MKWIIIGLGNVGPEYTYARHNAGKIVLDVLSARFAEGEWKERSAWYAEAVEGEIGGDKALFVFPRTMMNLSGKTAAILVKSKKQAAQTIVIHDDIDLPIGTWKFVFDRGSGGHRGVESIMRSLKTKAFVRIKIGVSPTALFSNKIKKPKAGDEVVEFVLGKFTKKEQERLNTVAHEIEKGVETLVTKGLPIAMNEFN